MSEHTTSECLQFADDTSLYRHCKVKNITPTPKLLESDIENLKTWSKDTNLVFNEDKTKNILFASSQMSKKHNLNDENTYTIKPGQTPNRKSRNIWKVLGVTFHQNLTWTNHGTSLITDGYSILRTLKKLKRLTPFHVRKLLASSLVLSKIDYGNVMLKNAPAYLIKRIQRLQNSTTGYVLGRYAKEKDVLSLNWLPVIERMDFSLSKMAHKATNQETWPEYLRLEIKPTNSRLRNRGEL